MAIDNRKVLVVDSKRYDIPVGRYGKLEFSCSALTENPLAFKLVVLTGGEDIAPGIYGHKTSKHCGYTNTYRDGADLLATWIAYNFGIPVVGICRGAQLLCAFHGGSLIQDCDNHDVWHNIETIKGEKIFVSSTHHQMMVPHKSSTVVAWASPRRSSYYRGGPQGKTAKTPELEADVVAFSERRALSVQYHPEYMPMASRAVHYFYELIEDYLGIDPMPVKLRDTFISLPKTASTDETALAEYRLQKSMGKKELEEHLEKQHEKNIFEYHLRKNLAELIPEDKAALKANEVVASYVKFREKNKEKPAEKQAVAST
jgi:GMP synthase-like glutamine amidotransferase